MAKILLVMLWCLAMVSISLCQVPTDRDALLNGEGAGQAKYADMYGYPGPKHVLDFETVLQLTRSQKTEVTKIYNDMLMRAKDLGKRIVYVEEELNSSFREGLVTERSLTEKSEQIGKLRGRLRAVHLAAHLRTRKILNSDQIEMYRKMRSTKSTN